MITDEPFGSIAAVPPALSIRDAEDIAERVYGRQAHARMQVSERDQNFLLTGKDGGEAVLKIANVNEPREVTLFQIEALRHIQKSGCASLKVPRIIRTVRGDSHSEVRSEQGEHLCRLVSFLPGRLLDETETGAQTARSLGASLAELDIALKDFSHPGEQQALLWDMKRAPALRRLLPYVQNSSDRALLAATLDEFEATALPQFGGLPWQVIHNDANPANVLVDDNRSVTGLIDFGDMLRSPRVIELGVAASYLRVDEGNPLSLVVELLSGYHSVAPLSRSEVSVLHSLVKTRLASTLLILAWRGALREADDPYLAASGKSEASAGPFLRRLDEIPVENAAAIYSQVCASTAVAKRIVADDR